MTKFKSKKITKSTIAVIIMAIAMVAMLAFGGTYALFTATTTAKTANIVTGRVSLTANSEFVWEGTIQGIVPKDVIIPAEMIKYDNASTVASYVAIKVVFEKKTGEDTWDELTASTLQDAHVTFAAGSSWTECQTSKFVFVKRVRSAENEVILNTAPITFDVEENYADGVSEYAATTGTLEGVTLRITFTAYSVQAKNLEITGLTDNGTDEATVTLTNSLAEAIYGKMKTA